MIFILPHKALTKWKLKMLGLFLFSLAFANPAMAEKDANSGFVVVIQKTEKNVDLSKKDLRKIFMGATVNREYRAVHLPAGHPVRVAFNTRVVGLTEARIQSYWAQLKFTGRGKPPLELESVEDVLEYLQKNPAVAAYVPSSIALPDTLAVIYP